MLAKAAVLNCYSVSVHDENLIAVSSRVAVMGLNLYQRRAYASTIEHLSHYIVNKAAAFVSAWSFSGTAIV